jgi:NAD(P)-dependent dehydrogenase (short-subunit alcohol dehydrogenase family)
VDSGLEGKTALITGGASGIGLGIAQALAAEGVDLAIASRNPDPAGLEALRAKGVRVAAIPTDVSREDQVQAMVSEAVRLFGHLDLYVNNAAWTWHQPITRLETSAWMNTIHTNLSSCLWACREVSRHMIARGEGSILIIGSTAMFTVQYRETAYRISKTGLKIAMEVLAVELAPYGIRVNMIIPGHFVTRMTAGFQGEPLRKLLGQTPLRRTGRPEEVGPAAVLLLSDKLSSYTTGTFLVIDGGLHLNPLPVYSDAQISEMNAISE